MHCYVDVSGFAQIGLSFTLNWLMDIFKSNDYPENFINDFFKSFWIANIEYEKK